MKIAIIPEKAFYFLLLIIGLLSVTNIVVNYLMFKSDTFLSKVFFKLFDVDTEVNFPSLYSTVTLLTCALLLFLIHFIENGKWIRSGYWSLLGLVFLFLAVDENISLHEKITGLLRNQFNFPGIFYYAWIVPYFLAVLLLGFYYLPFLLKLPRSIMYHFITAFLLFMGGAVGMEMIGGRHFSLHGHDVLLVVYYSIEEFLEMLGVAVFIKGLLMCILDSKASGKVKFKVVPSCKTVMKAVQEEV